HVEVSDGTIALDPGVKRELIEELAGEFTVLAEVGSKDADFIMAPYVWVEQIESDLRAGAWKVIAEARESGTAGIYRATGEVRTGLIDEIVHAVEPEHLIFEAPLREQQVWLLKQFGTECNLGNIAPADVLSLETLRLALRSDRVERFAVGGGDWPAGRSRRGAGGSRAGGVSPAEMGSRGRCSCCWSWPALRPSSSPSGSSTRRRRSRSSRWNRASLRFPPGMSNRRRSRSS